MFDARLACGSHRGPLLFGIALSACTAQDDPHRPPEPWEAEYEAQDGIGVDATIDVEAPSLMLTGASQPSDLVAPLSIAVRPVYPSETPYVFFERARVPGEGEGFVVLEASSLAATAGKLREFVASQAEIGERVALDTAYTPAERPDPDLPASWSEAEMAFEGASSIHGRADGLLIEGFSRGILLDGKGAKPLSGPLEIDADQIYLGAGSRVELESASVRYGAFLLAGDVTGGALSLEGREPVQPASVFGNDAVLALAPRRVQSEGSFSATQVIADEGLLLGAEVELLPYSSELRVAEGEGGHMLIHYRERSFRADAALEDVRIDGLDEGAAAVPVAPPDSYIERLWEEVEEADWAAPIVAIPIVLASPFALVLDAFEDALCYDAIFCPEQYPVPLWMDAGEMGVFYLIVDESIPPGTHDVTVRLIGQNYPNARASFTIVVE